MGIAWKIFLFEYIPRLGLRLNDCFFEGAVFNILKINKAQQTNCCRRDIEQQRLPQNGSIRFLFKLLL